MTDWQRFVVSHGWKADGYELAAVLGQPLAEILRFRGRGVCSRPRRKKVKRFAELFALWHGRPPRDDEWPRPRKAHRCCYEWQAPELALLASLVGRLGKPEISRILIKRLRKVTGDLRATRSLNAVQMGINHRLGMVTTDVVGGLTIATAGREIGSRAVIYQCIRKKELRPFRVGRLWVIPREKWEAWKKTRTFPPKGYVQLSTLKRPLGIRSDKLSEWARMGYMPTAVRCNPFGLGIHSTQFGTWFVDPKVARKLLADRRAGRPMPWWGKPEPGNLRITWRLLEERRHPSTCRTCAQIWGPKGAPSSYDDYAVRYPPLAHGAKRHLTRKWSPGLTIAEVAKLAGRSWSWVRRAIDNGTLTASRTGWRFHISRSDATHWKARRCPAGCHESSWTSLASARLQHQFTLAELRAFVAEGKLRSMVGVNGPMRGITYVSRHQVRQLREKIGFTEEQAARRVGVRVSRFRTLLEGVHWRGTGAIPLDTVNAVIKRRYSQDGGCTLEAAAAKLGTSLQWIHERKLDGTIRLMRAKWDRRRLYITEPMLERLRQAKRKPIKRERFGARWLLLSKAANEACVSNATIVRWAEGGELERRRSIQGWRYHRKAVRARARQYWKDEVRFRRAIAPDWFGPSPYDLSQGGGLPALASRASA
jgi:excisionase family DNA binding protein